jgi:hypothetical protein
MPSPAMRDVTENKRNSWSKARREMETKLREILLLHEKHVEIRYANERVERL